MVKRALGTWAVVALLAGAGACTERPVESVAVVKPGDANLACSQIDHEIAANEANALALIRNSEKSHAANVAMDVKGRWVFGPALVALDADDEDMGTLRALHARNQRLEQMAEEKHCRLEQGRWIGQGESDACGQPWAVSVGVEDGKVEGTLWRGRVSYDIQGAVDSEGQVKEAWAIRSRSAFGWTGPRFVRLDLLVTPEGAEGEFSVYNNGRISCPTAINLIRSKNLEKTALRGARGG